jgi:opacity protein-like surface antigen
MVIRIIALAGIASAALVTWCPATAENFIDVDVGAVYSDVSASEPSPVDGDFSSGEAGYHFAIGAYRNKDESPWVYGVKFEAQDAVGRSLIGIRAIDVGYRFTPKFTFNGFLGASRYDLTTAAYGYRLGIGGRYRLSDRWAVGAEAVFNDKLARDKVLPEENPGEGSPDIFYDIFQLSVIVNYRF